MSLLIAYFELLCHNMYYAKAKIIVETPTNEVKIFV